MLEKRTARSTKTQPMDQAKAAPGTAKATVIKPITPTGARKPAAPRRREDDMYERIQRRAYELWENEGRPNGREHDHWLQAEREIARARTTRMSA